MRRQAPNVERMHLLGAEVRAGRVRHEDAQGGDERGDPRLDHERRDDALPDRLLRRPGAVPGDRPRPPARDRRRGARAGARRRGPAPRRRGRLRRRRLERDRHLLRLHRGSRTSGWSASRRPARRASARAAPPSSHGARSSVLADDDGQIADAHSISAGLDYPGVGPEHAALRDSGRAMYLPCTDDEALAALHRLAETEGIIPALESSHALARALDLDAELVVVCLSGRGDKDLAEVRSRDADDEARHLPGLRARDARARRGRGRGRRRHRRARHPVLRPARRRPDDPPRLRAGAGARDAHGASASSASPTRARASTCRSCR